MKLAILGNIKADHGHALLMALFIVQAEMGECRAGVRKGAVGYSGTKLQVNLPSFP